MWLPISPYRRRFFWSAAVIIGLLFVLPGSSQGTVLNVPSDYSTLGAAISAATAGDTVSVAPGDYDEKILVSKDLTFIGGGRSSTVLWYSTQRDTVVTVRNANVRFEDLRVGSTQDQFGQAVQPAFIGIRAENGSVTIRRCDFFAVTFASVDIENGSMLDVRDAAIRPRRGTYYSDVGLRMEHTDFSVHDFFVPSDPGNSIDHIIDVMGDSEGTITDSQLNGSSVNYANGIRLRVWDFKGPTVTVRRTEINGNHDTTTDTSSTFSTNAAGIAAYGEYNLTVEDSEIRDFLRGFLLGSNKTTSTAPSVTVEQSTVESNVLYGIEILDRQSAINPIIDLGGGANASAGGNLIQNNDEFNDAYNVYNEGSRAVFARFNTWGPSSASDIDARIHDDNEGGSAHGPVYFGIWETSEEAQFARSVSASGSYKFGKTTGLTLDIPSASGSGTLVAHRYNRQTPNPNGIPTSENISTYGWVLRKQAGSFSLGGMRTLRIDYSVVSDPGISSPSDVQLYWRSNPETGTFLPLVTQYDANAGEIVTSDTVGYGEYVFVSGSNELPVELASFTGTQLNPSTVELRWTTASEKNNAGFRIQHRRCPVTGTKQDGSGMHEGGCGDTVWSTLGTVDGAGTSTQHTSYEYEANDLPGGKHHFRLVQLDVDGTKHALDPISVHVEMNERLRLVGPDPNPIRDHATLRLSGRTDERVAVAVYNLLGQKVSTLYRGPLPGTDRKTISLETDELAAGVYFLRMHAGPRAATRRFTVVR